MLVRRHVDTAQMYKNEKETADAIRESGIDREEIFVSKFFSTGVPILADFDLDFSI